MAIEILPSNSNSGIPTSFMKLTYANRQDKYLRLKMLEGKEAKYGPGATHIDIPILDILGLEEEVAVTGKQARAGGLRHIELVPACTVAPTIGSYKFQVEPNPELWKYGIVQAPYYLNNGEVPNLNVHMYIQDKIDLTKLRNLYAIRIYMRQ